MGTDLALSTRTEVARVGIDTGELDVAEYLLRLLDHKLIVIAPSEEIWHAYADSVGYKWRNSTHQTNVTVHGSQLVYNRIIAPVVLVVGLPHDLDFRFEMIGALTELQPTWEEQGGRVIYVEGWEPPRELDNKARMAAIRERSKVSRQEMIDGGRAR